MAASRAGVAGTVKRGEPGTREIGTLAVRGMTRALFERCALAIDHRLMRRLRRSLLLLPETRARTSLPR